MNSDVHFIVTGGTIDSVFDPAKDSIVVNNRSVIQDYLDSAVHPHANITFEILTLKDSREITDHIRHDIAASIEKSPASHVVVTHGTYTMPETARYLQKALPETKKTVVLTGAMIPIKGFSESDAPYNLGYAVAACQLLRPGVYLRMNSRVFAPENVRKNTDQGVFVNL